MAPNGIICYFREDAGPCPLVMRDLLLMLALLVTPIKTTAGGGAGPELMALLQLAALRVKDNFRGYFNLRGLAHKTKSSTQALTEGAESVNPAAGGTRTDLILAPDGHVSSLSSRRHGKVFFSVRARARGGRSVWKPRCG